MSNINERQQPAWAGSYYDDDELFDFYCKSTRRDNQPHTETTERSRRTRKRTSLSPLSSPSPIDTARDKSEIKYLFKRGERVSANWAHDYDGKYWYSGVVESFRELDKVHPIYGSVRMYSIIFDDGTFDKNISEEKVMKENDYLLFTNKKLRSQWTSRGIRNKLDSRSDDTYARTRGWFVTEKTGTTMFTSLSAAIKANDIKITGIKVKPKK